MSNDFKFYKLMKECSLDMRVYGKEFLVWIPYCRIEEFADGITEIYGECMNEYPVVAGLRCHEVYFDLNKFDFLDIDLKEVFPEEYED
ncbi:hypothetical protein LQZ18_04125 [Lachnospiraceae bacterium ZAX-1]